jgi:hypothetical protein
VLTQPLPSNGCFSGFFILAVRPYVTIRFIKETTEGILFKFGLVFYNKIYRDDVILSHIDYM